MVTAGSIVRETFALARVNPKAIAVWSALHILASLGMYAIMAPFYANRLAMMQGGGMMPGLFGPGFLVAMLLTIFLFAVLWAAAFRAALFPAERHAAYLRVGMDELRLIGTCLILTIAVYAGMVVIGMVFGLAAAAIGVVGGGGPGAIAAIVVAIMLALAAVGIFLGVRLSPAGPLTIARRRIIIGDAWRLTRGHFGALLGGYLLVGLVVVAIYLVLFALQLAPMLAAVGNLAEPGAAQRLMLWQAETYGRGLAGPMLLNGVIGGILGGPLLALQAGVIATATRLLIDDRDGSTDRT